MDIYSDLSGPVALWGFGREGRAMLAVLRARAPQLPVSIINDTPVADAPDDVPVLTGGEGSEALARGRFATIIKSPGISLYRPEVAAAKAAGSLVTSSTNLWLADHRDAIVIAVTGTKGKSTSSSLLHHLFGLAGKRAKLLGNVGSPVIASEPGADVTVLELSSYQIADLTVAPTIALFTNLHPEHGPWHEGHANYYRDKMRLAFIDPTIPAIANARESRLMSHLEGRGNVIPYQDEAGFHVRDGAVWRESERLDIRNLRLRGEHNLVNLAGAFAALDAAGAYQPGKAWDFADFHPLPHRLQEELLPSGVLAVNDSISTIPETTLAALAVHHDAPVHLLLGGTDRGQDFSALIAHLATLGNLASVHLLKGTGERLAEQCKMARLAFHGPHAAFDDAVKAALELAKPGERIVLSPGAPSQIEFADFEVRGRRFLELCRAFSR